MLRIVEQLGYKLLTHYALDNDRDQFLLLFSASAVFFALSMHIFFAMYFAIKGSLTFFYINCGSVSIYILAGYFAVHRHYGKSMILLNAEVCLYTFCTIFSEGYYTYNLLYLFIVQALNIVLPYAPLRTRVWACAGVWICLTLATGHVTYADIPFADTKDSLLVIFNTQAMFFGLVILLTVRTIINNIIISYNASELRKYQQVATVDPLTGLYNRRYVDDFFAKLGRRSNDNTYFISMVDVDNFKQFNDTFGHQAGDAVLQMVARILTTTLRKTDTVFRWGGEEFLICLKDVDVQQAQKILNTIRTNIDNERLYIGDDILHVTATFGACRLKSDAIRGCIAMCDSLMYQGKKSGKNVVVIVAE